MEPEANITGEGSGTGMDTELTVLCFTSTINEGAKDYCIVVEKTLDD